MTPEYLGTYTIAANMPAAWGGVVVSGLLSGRRDAADRSRTGRRRREPTRFIVEDRRDPARRHNPRRTIEWLSIDYCGK